MGDWIAVIGEGRDGNTVGKYELNKRNKRDMDYKNFVRTSCL